MITPNIENIIKSLVVKAGVMEMGEKIAWGSDTALMRQAAAALQTQAERIKELEAEIITRTSYGDEQTDFAIKLAAERDALRATLEQLVGALEGVRLCTPPAQRPMVREAITAGRAALANAEPIARMQPVTKTRVGNYLNKHPMGDLTAYRHGFKDGVKWREQL